MGARRAPARLAWVPADRARRLRPHLRLSAEARGVSAEIDRFLADLAHEGASPKTLQSYRTDLAHFAHWFAESTGEASAPAGVTPTDVRDYRAALLTVGAVVRAVARPTGGHGHCTVWGCAERVLAFVVDVRPVRR